MITKIDLTYKKNKKRMILEFFLCLVVNSIVLLMASTLFKGFNIASFWYALLAALVIILLNKTVKPFLVFLTLPVTIFTVGLFYPFINVIILKLTSLIMGTGFQIQGFFVPFFISLFISFMNILLDAIIVKPLTKEG